MVQLKFDSLKIYKRIYPLYLPSRFKKAWRVEKLLSESLERHQITPFLLFLTDRAEDSKLVHRRKRPKVDASIFDTALSHTRRSDASEKRQENSVSTF